MAPELPVPARTTIEAAEPGELPPRALQQLRLVVELGTFALTADDLDELLRRGFEAVAALLGTRCVALLEPVPGSDLLLMRAGAGWAPGIVGHLLVVLGGASALTRTLSSNEPTVVNGQGVHAFDGIPTFVQHGIVSGICVPIPAAGGSRGVFGAWTTMAVEFGQPDVLFLQSVANVFAGAIARKDTEQGLQQSEARLQSIQKMEAIGRLAGGIAHDFNNLVQAIGGYTEILLKRLPEHDPLHYYAEEINKAGDRAATLTRQLLAFSRQQVLQTSVLAINDIVTQVEQLLRRLIGEDIELETALAPDVGAIKADAAQLERVLMNLAVNSRDAMPEGGTLTIETRNVELTKADQREAFSITPGPYVLLAVTDTGVGMDADTRARAFEPFFTTKPAGHGTGLGLSTVYGIVKQSGGYIWVDSEVGQGTRVRIYLPCVRTPVPAVVEAPRRVRGGPRGSETLLLVEDEDGVRELIREWMSGHGYSVLVAENGVDALGVASEYGGPVDLLIADVVMPQMGGPELASKLLPLRPDMKVIYVSGYADEAIGDPDMLAAGSAFLQKPFTLDSLLHKVREVLDTPS